MRIIRNENDRLVIAVQDLNDKIEAADKNGYQRGWSDSRNQLRNLLKTLADKDVADKITKTLGLADS
jgi:hypothetical protein